MVRSARYSAADVWRQNFWPKSVHRQKEPDRDCKIFVSGFADGREANPADDAGRRANPQPSAGPTAGIIGSPTMSAPGPEPTCRDVRHESVIGGRTDLTQTSDFGRY